MTRLIRNKRQDECKGRYYSQSPHVEKDKPFIQKDNKQKSIDIA